MRRRLINSTLAVVLVVIAVFGVSLVIVETRTISSSAQESVNSEALRLVSVIDSRMLAGETVGPQSLAGVGPDRYARIDIPGRAPSSSAPGPAARSSAAPPPARAARPSWSRSPAPRSPGRSGAPC